MLVPFSPPPGMRRNGTEYESLGAWYGGDRVHWVDGHLQPIPGWRSVPFPGTASIQAMSGKVRGGIAWRDSAASPWSVWGSSTHLYAWNGSTLYDITPVGFTPGREDTIYAFGFGTGAFGNEAFGTPRTEAGTALVATTWGMDNWGENWVGVASHEGTIYEWAPVPTNPAVPIANAPTATEVVVTPERHLVALGADGDLRLIRWSDQGDNTVWTPTATNRARDLPLQTSGIIVTGVRVRRETLILTTLDAHVLRPVGGRLVYGLTQVGSECGIIGRHAYQEFDGRVVWMGERSFFLYDGMVRSVDCPVSEYVFGDINELQATKVHAHYDPEYGEVLFFYPSAGSNEVDRYVLWNHRDNVWATGNLNRTTFVGDGVFPTPFATDENGVLFYHNDGWSDDGSPMGAHALTGPLELNNGDAVTMATRYVPDAETIGQAEVLFYGREAPSATQHTFGPYELSQDTPVRLWGRQVSMLVRAAPGETGFWRWGRPRLDVVQGGRR